MTRQLPIDQPFDLALSLTMGQAFRWYELPPDFYGDGYNWFSGVLGENLIHIRQTDAGVEYRVGDAHGERDANDADDQLLRRYFREDTDDVATIYEDISRDPVVAGLVRRYPGMRVLRQDPLECVVTYICTPGTPIPRVRDIIEAMATEWGEKVTLSKESRYLFPEPSLLMRTGRWLRHEMRPKLRFSEQQSSAVVTTARLVVSGDLDWRALADQPYDAVIQRLKAIKGIGYKIADCAAMMSLERFQAFPLDVWVKRAMETWYPTDFPMPDNPTNPSKKDHDAITAWVTRKFGPYAGYAGQHLFHGIEPHKEYVRRDGSCPCCKAEALAAGLRYEGPVWK